LGSAKQAADYKLTTDFKINYIKWTFAMGNNIRKTLEIVEEIDINLFKLSLAISLSQDKEVRIAGG
jgi:hypothetical protein